MESGQRKRIVLFGDSITQGSFSSEHRGWGGRLSEWLCRYVDVLNRGFSGYNSRWALSILPSILGGVGSASLAVVFFGANDSVQAGESQHVPLEEYDQNLRSIIDIFKEQNPDIALILVTPPPVDHTRWPSRHNELVSTYAEAVRRIAVDKAAVLVDLWITADAIAINDLEDGLHLNESGNSKVFFAVQRGIREAWPHLASCCSVPMQYPDWKLLQGQAIEESIQIVKDWKWN